MKEYFAFQWHITDHCDQRCEHCYIFAEDRDIPLQEMQWADMERVLDNCREMCDQLGRQPYFYITGGDPILHRDFWRLAERLKTLGISFGILGNPFHLDAVVCERLYRNGCERYQLSIDGLRETHDSIRKPGSFDATLEKIPVIKAAGMRAVIMTTVSKRNLYEIPAIIDLVVVAKADVFAFARYCPTSLEKSAHVSPREYQALLAACWAKFEAYRDRGTTFNLKDHLWTLFLYEKGLFTIPEELLPDVVYDGCNCGISHLTILPGGDVYACRRMESAVGNALSERLLGIFLGDKMDEYRAYDKFSKCSKCELLRFCRGCPAVACGHTGDFRAADPQCWKEVAV